MPIDPDDLPSEVTTLRALLAAQAAEMAIHRTELAAARAGLLEQRYEIEALRGRLARALRVAFGGSSEKLRGRMEQLELTLADLDELLAETAPNDATATVAPIEAEPSQPARRPLPRALPRDVIEPAAPCDSAGACVACGGMLRKLGEDVTELLDYVPGSFRVIRHVRPKLSCRACETITQAPSPSLPSRLTAWRGISPLRGLIRRGRAGAGRSWPRFRRRSRWNASGECSPIGLGSQYGDHWPLHRQAEIDAREDLDLGRSTLADMVGGAGSRFRPA